MESARIFANTQLDKALDDFAKRQAAGVIGDQTFAQWATGNAPAYMAATQSYQSKVAAYQKAYKNAYGPLADTKLEDEAKLARAKEKISQNVLPGYVCTSSICEIFRSDDMKLYHGMLAWCSAKPPRDRECS